MTTRRRGPAQLHTSSGLNQRVPNEGQDSTVHENGENGPGPGPNASSAEEGKTPNKVRHSVC
jgi:hypothetical protein